MPCERLATGVKRDATSQDARRDLDTMRSVREHMAGGPCGQLSDTSTAWQSGSAVAAGGRRSRRNAANCSRTLPTWSRCAAWPAPCCAVPLLVRRIVVISAAWFRVVRVTAGLCTGHGRGSRVRSTAQVGAATVESVAVPPV
jgi:hypothetical protein